MAERALWRSGSGVSDIFGTLLLVLAVVVLGSALSVLVAQTLSTEGPDAATYALARAHAGDAQGAVALQEGERVPLTDLRLHVARGTGALTEVTLAAWTTPDPEHLRPGDSVRFPIPGGALAEGERLFVQLTRSSTNSVVASLATSAGGSAPRLSAVTLAASMTPSTIKADATSTALLTVTTTQEQGALSVASVVADFGALGQSARHEVALADDGRAGDAHGGDGIWSALVRIPVTAPSGAYSVRVDATLVDGVTTGTTTVPVTIESSSLNVDANGNAIGNMTGNFTGNFTGPLHGAPGGVNAGRRAAEGTRLSVPSSANATRFDLRNWTFEEACPYRLNADSMLIHVAGGNASWSALLSFTWSNATRAADQCDDPGMYQISQLRMWSRSGDTTYTPNAPINLSAFTLDLLDPLASGTWTTTGSAHPAATYGWADVTIEPYFILSTIEDSSSGSTGGGGAGGPPTSGGASTSSGPSIGVYAVDVAFV